MADSWDEALDAVDVLVEPVRRAMYGFVRGEGRAVTREEVAAATGTSVKLAAFHLEKLVEHGWLRSQSDGASRPVTGGRPPKRYAATDRQVELSLPPRRYDLMGQILLQASQSTTEQGTGSAIRQAAHDRGRAAGERFRGERRLRRPLGPERTLAAAAELLGELGFEPRRSGEELALSNCPFRALADTDTGTVCEANHALAEGVLAGLGGTGVDAALDRAPDRCCVVLSRSEAPRG